eukprot:SAG31_NODE_404_length_16109_cov_10.686696_11_plen_180_part_00
MTFSRKPMNPPRCSRLCLCCCPAVCNPCRLSVFGFAIDTGETTAAPGGDPGCAGTTCPAKMFRSSSDRSIVTPGTDIPVHATSRSQRLYIRYWQNSTRRGFDSGDKSAGISHHCAAHANRCDHHRQYPTKGTCSVARSEHYTQTQSKQISHQIAPTSYREQRLCFIVKVTIAIHLTHLF